MIVDAHQHLWRIGQNGHEWPTADLGAIYRDFGPADLQVVTEEAGVTATVLVQSQPNDADTDWMLDIAAETPLIKGVVGWTDLAAPDAAARIAALARRPKLKGLRPMLQGLGDDGWILRDDVRPALNAMCDYGLTFDALVFTRHLPFIAQLAERHSDLAIVIDHGAKPPISEDLDFAWANGITRLAAHESVYCKLSGLLTEMAPHQSLVDMTSYADHLYAAFGPDRVMWGSDWPVVLLRDSYRAWFDWTSAWLTAKPPSVRAAILGGTATRFYTLN